MKHFVIKILLGSRFLVNQEIWNRNTLAGAVACVCSCSWWSSSLRSFDFRWKGMVWLLLLLLSCLLFCAFHARFVIDGFAVLFSVTCEWCFVKIIWLRFVLRSTRGHVLICYDWMDWFTSFRGFTDRASLETLRSYCRVAQHTLIEIQATKGDVVSDSLTTQHWHIGKHGCFGIGESFEWKMRQHNRFQ